MQKELEAMLSNIDKMDPIQMLRETNARQTAKMNEDLAMLEEKMERDNRLSDDSDASSSGEEDNHSLPSYQQK